MCQLGYPKEPLISLLLTFQNLKQYIRTAYGESEVPLDFATIEGYINSIGQGNGCGPQAWGLVSTVILNMMRNSGHTARFRCPITGEMVELVGFAFVDDANIMVTADGSHGIALAQEATARMQESADTWVGGLHASGGAIVVEKSHWTLIDFAWDEQGNPRYRLKDETPECQVSVIDFDGVRKPLK
jgi:hypothetical protein